MINYINKDKEVLIKTIFINPGEGIWDESIYAKEVSDLYNSEHIPIKIPETFDAEYEKIINSFDEPFSHPTIFPLLEADTQLRLQENPKYPGTRNVTSEIGGGKDPA